MNDTKVNFIQKVINNNPVEKSWFIPVTISLISIVTMVQIILFGTGATEGTKDREIWLEYLMFGVQIISSSLVIIGAVLSFRKNKKFIYYHTIAHILFVVNGVVSGLIIEAAKRTIQTVIFFFVLKSWSKEEKKIKFSEKKDWTKVVPMGIFILVAISVPMMLFSEGTPVEPYSTAVNWLETASFVFVLIAMWMLMNSKAETNLMFLMGDLLMMITFAIMQQWIMVVSTFIFVMMNVFGSIYWVSQGVSNRKQTPF